MEENETLILVVAIVAIMAITMLSISQKRISPHLSVSESKGLSGEAYSTTVIPANLFCVYRDQDGKRFGVGILCTDMRSDPVLCCENNGAFFGWTYVSSHWIH